MIYDHILITDSTSEPTNELEFFTEELSVYHIPVNESPQQPPKKKLNMCPRFWTIHVFMCQKKWICFWCFIFKQKIPSFHHLFKTWHMLWSHCMSLNASKHAHSEINTCRCTRSNWVCSIRNLNYIYVHKYH